ncbi:MAG TPA: EAL domain-containing protein [Accumulibacter sp.]|nr:EAL domain-containing protein [Accumulibacter sp.]HMW78931.1 EAL domain-containing protein [Accumulibacter sp.]
MNATPNVDFRPQIPARVSVPATDHILVVGDQGLSGFAYDHLLGAKDRHLEECHTGNEAFTRLDRGDIDLLILDLDLPDMQGSEIMEWMRQKEIATAVIIFSRQPTVESAIGALRYGAYEFIRQHDEPAEVVESVERALLRHRRERECALMVVRLEHSERLYRLLVEQSPDIIYTLDEKGCFLFVNGRVQFLLGHSQEELIGQHYSVIVHPDDVEHARFAFNERRIGDRASTNVEIRLQGKVPGVRHFENRTIVTVLSARGLYASPNQLAQPHFIGTSGVARDISERKKAEEAITFQAFHDLLTGLPNRVLFKDRLTLALRQAKRQGQRLAVMFIDIDRFKLVNDTYGHHEGDELLKCFAKRARACLRSGDTLARQGGDEFTVLLPDVHSGDDAGAIAGKILGELQRPFTIAGQPLLATASIGIALFPDDGETPDALLGNADIAMYQIKGRGKNGYQEYQPAMRSGHSHRVTLERDLRRALAHGDQFEVYYQPLISMSRQQTIGVEALLRWHHPEHGLMAPDLFIPLAEDSGMIVDLSNWVLNQALRQLAHWRGKGMRELRMALNISPREFAGSDLYERLMRGLDVHAVPAEALDIEISEHLLTEDAERHIDIVKRLHHEGLRVSIDDFGTRYSSLNHLRRFPISSLKIDQSFIRDLNPHNRKSTAIVDAIFGIARSFGLRTLAEGVETDLQKQLLRGLMCDEMQGFLFSRPLSAAEFEEFLAAGAFPSTGSSTAH